jgi:hypothetical protein
MSLDLSGSSSESSDCESSPPEKKIKVEKELNPKNVENSNVPSAGEVNEKASSESRSVHSNEKEISGSPPVVIPHSQFSPQFPMSPLPNYPFGMGSPINFNFIVSPFSFPFGGGGFGSFGSLGGYGGYGGNASPNPAGSTWTFVNPQKSPKKD